MTYENDGGFENNGGIGNDESSQVSNTEGTQPTIPQDGFQQEATQPAYKIPIIPEPASQDSTYQESAYQDQAYQEPEYKESPYQGASYQAPNQTPKKRGTKDKSKAKTFIWGLVGVLVGCALAIGGVCIYENVIAPKASTTTTSSTDSTGVINITPTTEDATLPETVAAKCLPSVVSIDVYTSTNSQSSYFGSQTSQDEESTLQRSTLGSGVILSTDGYILTNYHVVEGGAKYVVHFEDDSTAEATLVGSDSSSDIAVLKVDASGKTLTPIEVGDSSDVNVGEWVMAIGSPFGLTKSVSTGIVSALYRSDSLQSSYGTAFYVNMIQVDAAINPGNSGGALVNSEGKLIGINTMISSYSGDSSGVGFAIPGNYAIDIANQIIDKGYAQHPYLGASLGTVDAGSASYYNTTAKSGAYVGKVVSGSPAEAAGLKAGDVIVSYNGKEVTTASELIIDVRASSIGDTVELGVVRGGSTITVTATLVADSSSQ